MDKSEVLNQILSSFQDSAIRDRSYYPDFRRQWESLLKKTLNSEAYYDTEAPSILKAEHSFAGIDAVFHFDQLKIADWYRQDSSRKKRVVFQAVRVAVCGNIVSPPLGETMALIGRDDCLARIDRARTMAL